MHHSEKMEVTQLSSKMGEHSLRITELSLKLKEGI